MLIILEIIDIFFYSQRTIIERLFARRTTPEELIPPMDAVIIRFIYN